MKSKGALEPRSCPIPLHTLAALRWFSEPSSRATSSTRLGWKLLLRNPASGSDAEHRRRSGQSVETCLNRLKWQTSDTENSDGISMLLSKNPPGNQWNYRRGTIGDHWYSDRRPATGLTADVSTVVAPAAVDAGALATVFRFLRRPSHSS